jgi:hypothetical protein
VLDNSFNSESEDEDEVQTDVEELVLLTQAVDDDGEGSKEEDGNVDSEENEDDHIDDTLTLQPSISSCKRRDARVLVTNEAEPEPQAEEGSTVIALHE